MHYPCSRSIFPRNALTFLRILNRQPRISRKHGIDWQRIFQFCHVWPRFFLRRFDLLVTQRTYRSPLRFFFFVKSQHKFSFYPSFPSIRRSIEKPRVEEHLDRSGYRKNAWKARKSDKRRTIKIRKPREKTRARSKWVTLTMRQENRPCNSQIEDPIAWSNLRTH